LMATVSALPRTLTQEQLNSLLQNAEWDQNYSKVDALARTELKLSGVIEQNTLIVSIPCPNQTLKMWLENTLALQPIDEPVTAHAWLNKYIQEQLGMVEVTHILYDSLAADIEREAADGLYRVQKKDKGIITEKYLTGDRIAIIIACRVAAFRLSGGIDKEWEEETRAFLLKHNSTWEEDWFADVIAKAMKK
jgi:hypothetical protein